MVPTMFEPTVKRPTPITDPAVIVTASHMPKLRFRAGVSGLLMADNSLTLEWIFVFVGWAAGVSPRPTSRVRLSGRLWKIIRPSDGAPRRAFVLEEPYDVMPSLSLRRFWSYNLSPALEGPLPGAHPAAVPAAFLSKEESMFALCPAQASEARICYAILEEGKAFRRPRALHSGRTPTRSSPTSKTTSRRARPMP